MKWIAALATLAIASASFACELCASHPTLSKSIKRPWVGINASLTATPVGRSFQSLKPSRDQQLKLGQDEAAKIRQTMKVLPASDPRVKLLRELGAKLLTTYTGPSDNFKYTFDVIDSPEVNAFALPGGPIFFFTGLIDKMKTVDELAGVLGHEITHVKREHWARNVEDSQKRSLGLLLIFTLGNPGRELMDVASLANSIYDLKFSRGHETQADDEGVNHVSMAGFNPEGMALVFETFRQLKKDAPPEWLSTHPDDRNRINRIRQKAAQRNQIYPKMVPLPFRTKAMEEKPQNPVAPGTAGGKGGG